MDVAHLSWVLSRLGGGIPPLMFSLGRAQAALGAHARWLGVEDPLAPGDPPIDARTQVFAIKGPRALGYAPSLKHELRVHPPEVLHLHGLFTWSSAAARAFVRRTKRPLVTAPQGMLEPWALRNSALKKRLFRALVEDSALRAASCFQVMAEAEASHIRALGFRRPMAVLPNGVELPPPPDAAELAALDAAHPELRGRPVVLFLGRIHPKKGLLHLVQAWSKLERRQAALVIAGPDQLSHRAEVEAKTNALGLERDIFFIGPVHGARKQAWLHRASFFVLPSFSEGFSVAVLEALASGVPVAITHECNFDEVATAQAGLVGSPTVESTQGMLTELLGLSEPDRLAMGQRARALVERSYAWSEIAAKSLRLYEWLSGGGARPEFVID